jgi:hypothetical protein
MVDPRTSTGVGALRPYAQRRHDFRPNVVQVSAVPHTGVHRSRTPDRIIQLAHE